MRKVALLLAALLLLALCIPHWKTIAGHAQEQQYPPGATSAQEFKNIQVLKDLPADQLKPLMRIYEQSLGVGCSFCHLRNSASDDSKPQKRAARNMILMTNAINQQNFSGEPKVSCYTCHRGTPHPVSELPFSPQL